MEKELKVGIEYKHTFVIPENKLVPALYPEAEEFLVMPEVFATGYLVGLIEWACIKAVKPYLDWPKMQTVGIKIDVSHMAATPAGYTVTINSKLIEIIGKHLIFQIEANDGVDIISKGKHERFIINKEKFDSKLKDKALAI